MNNTSHVFVICAYKESRYLCECIESLKRQSIPSMIVCSTSTPNTFIESVCRAYNIPLHINPKRNGISEDWNYAISIADADFVTLVHQDDIYEPYFLETTLNHCEKAKRPLIAFTDYYEIRGGKKIASSKLLSIKKIMCIPWRLHVFQKSRFITRSIFSFGNPICCPSVTFVLKNLQGNIIFNKEYKVSCDWLAWINIRNQPGEFVYCPKILVGHRIHLESETTGMISNNVRDAEDIKILNMLNPFMARFIYRFYRMSQDNNKL